MVKKDDNIYYAFYADQNPGRSADVVGSYEGLVELRGLQDGVVYSVLDYENGVAYGSVTGPTEAVNVNFRNHLLLEVIPQNR